MHERSTSSSLIAHARTLALLGAAAFAGCAPMAEDPADGGDAATDHPSPTDAAVAREASTDAPAPDVADDGSNPGRDAGGDDAANAPDAGGGADSGTCHTAPWTDPTRATRDACTFANGATVEATLGDATTIAAARAAIQHVFIITQENHSMDTYFGHTGHGIEGVPAGYTNPDASGNAVAPHHFTNSCPCDISHSTGSIATEFDSGRMDGFLRADGTTSLGYFDDTDHPFYTWMITTFATSDRYFCALMGPTGPNRDYLYAASTVPGATTIFDQLDRAGVSWGNYVAGYRLSADGTTLVGGNNLEGTYGHDFMLSHTHAIGDLMTGLASGAGLPPVSYIDVGPDEHPGDSGTPVNDHAGENAVRNVVAALLASPLWAHSALIMNYDEGGGFFDHVPPPSACVATASPADAPFNHVGIRVPLFVVSPYARPAYVSHRVHSHTSVLRFVQLLHDLPALNRRDANADALLDLFDFGCPSFPTAPASVPAAATPTSACSVCVH